MKKLSIITINFNNREGLERTIESVVNQSYTKFEYIIIDGGSTDGSTEIIRHNQNKITYWISEPDDGIYNAMNKGVKVAKGEYLLFLNSGDKLHNSAVLQEVFNENIDSDFILTKTLFENTGMTSDLDTPMTMLRFYEGGINHPSTFIKRSLLEKYPYDEKLKIVSDYKFFVQTLILKNSSFCIKKIIVSDFDTTGISSSNKFLVDKERESVLKELLPERIIIDYMKFVHGSEYHDDEYDKFFISLKKYTYSTLIYNLDLFLVKTLSLFKKSARFSRRFKYNKIR